MRESKLLTVEYMKELINDSLFENDLINQEVYLKCSKPKHIQALPGDGRTTDPNVLQKRKKELDKRIKKQNELVKELSDKEKKSKNKLDEWGNFLRKDIDKIDKNLKIVFEDHFGELGTDEPEMDTADIARGGDPKHAKAREKMMGEWYKINNEFIKFKSKMDTAISKRKDKKSLDRIISSFYKKLNRFNKKYDKYRKDWGPGYYMDTVTRGLTDYHPSDIAYRELNSAFRNTEGNDFSLSKLYGSYHEDWTTVKNDLKNEKNVLKDYKNELKDVNGKLIKDGEGYPNEK